MRLHAPQDQLDGLSARDNRPSVRRWEAVDDVEAARYLRCMTTNQIENAVAALRAAGYLVEAVTGMAGIYRVDERGAWTGPELLAMAIQLGLLQAPEQP